MQIGGGGGSLLKVLVTAVDALGTLLDRIVYNTVGGDGYVGLAMYEPVRHYSPPSPSPHARPKGF